MIYDIRHVTSYSYESQVSFARCALRLEPKTGDGQVLISHAIDIRPRPAERTARVEWKVALPLDAQPWNVGLIVGPSGCGKSTIARHLFGTALAESSQLMEWPEDRALLDAFPEDLSIKGFATVADALQHSSFSTGAVQGPQFSVGFTPGAQTLSLFGLSPSYTKYLIDGRPIADYPALYNGTDVITGTPPSVAP